MDHPHWVAAHVDLFLALINRNVGYIQLWNRNLVFVREEAS